MKAIALFARTTIVGGVFFLAPIVVLIVILAEAFGCAKTGLHAVVTHIPGVSDLNVGVATAFDRDDHAHLLSGWACRTYSDRATLRQRTGIVGAVEHSGLRISETGERKRLGVPEIGELPVIPMEGGWQLGVQTEALSNGLVSIFVLGAPNPHSGSVFFFSMDIVRPAGIKLAAGLGCLRRCGPGASALGASWPSADVRG
jgi:hypothetical protein